MSSQSDLKLVERSANLKEEHRFVLDSKCDQDMEKTAAQKLLSTISCELQTLQQQTAALKREYKEVKTTTLKVDQMRQNYPKIVKEIYRLKELKQDLETEISALQSRSGKADGMKILYKEQMSQLNLLTKEAESLLQTRNALKDSLQHLKGLKSESDQIQAEKQRIEERNSNLSMEVTSLQEQIKDFGDLQKKLCSVKEETSVTDEDTAFYEKKIHDLKSELYDLYQQNEVLEQETQTLKNKQKRNKEIRKQYDNMLREKAHDEKLQKIFKAQISDLRVQKDDTIQLLNQYEQEKIEGALLKDQTRKLQETKTALIESLQNQRNLKSDFSNIKAENQKSKKIKADLSLEVKQLQEEIQGLNDLQEKRCTKKEESLRAEEDPKTNADLPLEVTQLQEETSSGFDEVQDEPCPPKKGPIILPSPSEKVNRQKPAWLKVSQKVQDTRRDQLDQEEDDLFSFCSPTKKNLNRRPRLTKTEPKKETGTNGGIRTSENSTSLPKEKEDIRIEHEDNSDDEIKSEPKERKESSESSNAIADSSHSSFVNDYGNDSFDEYTDGSDDEIKSGPTERTESSKSPNNSADSCFSFSEVNEYNSFDEDTDNEEHSEPNGRTLSHEKVLEDPACSSFEKVEENLACNDFQETLDNAEPEPRNETASMEDPKILPNAFHSLPEKQEVLSLKEDLQVTSDEKEETKPKEEEVSIKDTNIFKDPVNFLVPKRRAGCLPPICNTATKKSKPKKAKGAKKKSKEEC
ncbi:protein Hook homolog 3-like [Oryzias melastigma]|uniref:protein Hook homolog 3-like n=1 Tax=Oryzias melastigma TaxID=30732 RepID=UPI000CF83C2D|nr:protein Hook homolog 3-like [Oryzias melastigma]